MVGGHVSVLDLYCLILMASTNTVQSLPSVPDQNLSQKEKYQANTVPCPSCPSYPGVCKYFFLRFWSIFMVEESFLVVSGSYGVRLEFSV